MSLPVSIVAEIPEALHASLRHYLETHPQWDQDRVFAAALSLFLLQNTDSQAQGGPEHYRACAQVYLETLFHQSN